MHNIARLIVSGLRGGSGKTLLSLGLARALTQSGLRLKVFKKGPDYIDAAWLSLAAGGPASNLDLFFLPPDRLRSFFIHALTPRSGTENTVNFALIEGNRGLFDGRDAGGSCSTAELARTLRCPTVIILDCTKMTRTAAALISGINSFEAGFQAAGVILNKIGSERHSAQVRRAIEHYCSVPVIGALPRFKENPLPERHMGLALPAKTGPSERGRAGKLLDALAATMREHLDLTRLLRLARAAPPLPPAEPFWPEEIPMPAARPRIGYVRDAALWFYYEENLEALERAGAELVRLSLLDGRKWPRLDGLYLGGGFPEEFAAELAGSPKLALLGDYAHSGMPIYAECGGLLILAHSLERDGRSYPMAGIFPLRAHFHTRPQGLGYVEAAVVLPNPFHPVDTLLKGHEFHYTRCAPMTDAGIEPALHLRCGTGLGQQTDGLVYKSVFAAYTHIFAPATPNWAERFVSAAAKYKPPRKSPRARLSS